jgi:hypothetical protein
MMRRKIKKIYSVMSFSFCSIFIEERKNLFLLKIYNKAKMGNYNNLRGLFGLQSVNTAVGSYGLEKCILTIKID